MDGRSLALKVVLVAVVLLALALVAMEVFDAPWLGFAVMALGVVILLARGISIYGVRGFALVAAVMASVVAVAFIAQRVS